MLYDAPTWWAEYPPKFVYKDGLIEKAIIMNYWRKIFGNKNQPISVYINIPFCEKRCFFCKYYAEIKKSDSEIVHYLDCLEKELALYKINFKNTVLDNIYIGGGTPTLLNERLLEKLFKIIYKHFSLTKSSQILIEGTPESSNYKKLELLKNLGVNRFTIGVQSFDEEVLRKANRGHSVQDIYEAFNNALKANIKYVNLDILLELPGETEESYRKTLKGLLDLRPACISLMTLVVGKRVAYPLKEMTRSFSARRQLKYKMLPAMISTLKDNGYQLAKGFSDTTLVLSGKEAAVNRGLLNRYKLNPVLGIGASAGSWVKPLKYSIPFTLKDYLGFLDNNRLPPFKGVLLTEDECIRRYLIHCFVLWGKISKKDFFNLFQKDIKQIMANKFKSLPKQNILLDTGKDLIFLPNWRKKLMDIKHLQKYDNQELLSLFCLKHFFSKSVLNYCERYLKSHLKT